VNINAEAISWIQGIIFVGLFVWASNTILRTLVRPVALLWKLPHRLRSLHRKRRGQEMIRRARQVGYQVVMNVEARITAVCAYSEFRAELLAQLRRRGSELAMTKHGSTEWRKLMAAKLIAAPPKIYTFSSAEGLSLMALTGDREELEKLAGYLVFFHTNIQRHDVSRENFETALGLLVARDPRLLVPFTDGGKSLTDEEFRLYAALETSEMTNHLVKSIS
jgi:hypothetical protein